MTVDSPTGAPGNAAPAARAPRLLAWNLLSKPPLSHAVAFVCLRMIRRVELQQGPPVAQSQSKIVRLWRCDRFAQVARSPQPWQLRDGLRLTAEDPVLELHIASDLLMKEIVAGRPWRELIAREFRSLVPQLDLRGERAIVGTTILIRQVEDFGASTRAVPPSLHTRFDTFYRRLILLTFHPGGVKRVLSHRYGLVEAAISLSDFCARYR